MDKTHTLENAMTACCIWEWMLENKDAGGHRGLIDWWEGAWIMREQCAVIAPAVDALYASMQPDWEKGKLPSRVSDLMDQFDWEFVPAVMDFYYLNDRTMPTAEDLDLMFEE